MGEIRRYKKHEILRTALNPFDDVLCWIEGLTSASYVAELLKSNHSLQGPLPIEQRSSDVAKLAHMACRYLEQAAKGPKEVSFLPIYYALLNLAKAYIVIGPYGHELNQNRRHGASYDTEANMGDLEGDSLQIHERGTIPLLYHTLTGKSMFQKSGAPLTVSMGDVYPYILDISAEYRMATGKQTMLIPFDMQIDSKGEKRRIVAQVANGEEENLKKVETNTLQAFDGLYVEPGRENTIVSDWYDEGDTAFLHQHLRLPMLYGLCVMGQHELQCVPSSKGTLLLPEELPLLLAFYHMSSVVRYNPDAFESLAGSKCWPLLLALRTQGAFKFLLLFWRFVTQCSTYIVSL